MFREKLKLYELVEDWLKETYPAYAFDSNFEPFAEGGRLLGLGKVVRMAGHPICRVTDVNIVQWVNPKSLPDFHAADPDFFEKTKLWIDTDVIPWIASRE